MRYAGIADPVFGDEKLGRKEKERNLVLSAKEERKSAACCAFPVIDTREIQEAGVWYIMGRTACLPCHATDHGTYLLAGGRNLSAPDRLVILPGPNVAPSQSFDE